MLYQILSEKSSQTVNPNQPSYLILQPYRGLSFGYPTAIERQSKPPQPHIGPMWELHRTYLGVADIQTRSCPVASSERDAEKWDFGRISKPLSQAVPSVPPVPLSHPGTGGTPWDSFSFFSLSHHEKMRKVRKPQPSIGQV